MMANGILVAASLALLAVPLVLVALGFAGGTGRRRLVHALFPASQMAIVAFIAYFLLTQGLEVWLALCLLAACAVSAVGDVVLFRALRIAEDKELAEERVRLLEQQVAVQEEQRKRLEANAREARRIREDVAAELRAADALLAQRQTDEARVRMESATGRLGGGAARMCDHRVVDALLAAKARACAEASIDFDAYLDVPDDLPFEDVELCAVFSNVVDNAANACRQVDEGRRFILLTARCEKGFFIVDARNSCLPEPAMEAGKRKGKAKAKAKAKALARATHAGAAAGAELEAAPKDARSDGDGGIPERGWGLAILQAIAQRHDGSLTAEREGADEFRTVVILSLDASGV